MILEKTFSSFLKNRRGSTAVEFALLALPFFALITGVIQLGILFLANLTLDEALETASRAVFTGEIQRNSASNFGSFRDTVCGSLILVSDCENNIQLSVQSFPDAGAINSNALFNSDGFPIIQNGTFVTGDPNDVVIISASITLPIVGGSLLLGNGNGSTVLSSSVAFQTEDF